MDEPKQEFPAEEAIFALCARVSALESELTSVRGKLDQTVESLERERRYRTLAELRKKFVFDLKRELARSRSLTPKKFGRRLRKLAETSVRAPRPRRLRLALERSHDETTNELAELKREVSEKIFWATLATRFPDAPIRFAGEIASVEDYARALFDDLVNSTTIDDFITKVRARLNEKK